MVPYKTLMEHSVDKYGTEHILHYIQYLHTAQPPGILGSSEELTQ